MYSSVFLRLRPQPTRDGKMKIAVCIFGQPRFYKECAESFRREFFDMPGHDVDVFMHAWSEVGYVPKNDWDKTNTKCDANKLKDDLYNAYKPPNGHMSIVIEDPEEAFGKTCDSVASVISFMRQSKWKQDSDWAGHMGKLSINTLSEYSDKCAIRIGDGKVIRYELGQWYSIAEAVKMKSWHEKQNNFKYDAVVRVRTDTNFFPKEIYKNEQSYYENKENYYSKLKKENKTGIVGEGLSLIIAPGNKATKDFRHAAQAEREGNINSGFRWNLSEMIMENNEIVNMVSVDKELPYPNAFRGCLIDDNGMLKYPFKFHQKDWLMYTDSDTADRAWGPIPTTYISIILNDILRFVGNKQVSFMPAGEIVCGAAAVLSNSSMYLPPEQQDMPSDCFTRGTRCIKIVHPDKKLRKADFQNALGDGKDVIKKGKVRYSVAEPYDAYVQRMKNAVDIKVNK